MQSHDLSVQFTSLASEYFALNAGHDSNAANAFIRKVDRTMAEWFHDGKLADTLASVSKSEDETVRYLAACYSMKYFPSEEVANSIRNLAKSANSHISVFSKALMRIYRIAP